MPSTFHPLNKNCPICSGARRDCRENNHNGLIHCRHDVTVAPGYKCVGEDKLGFFMWAVDDRRTHSAQEWEQLRRERAAERERLLCEEAQRCAQLLSVEERDREIQKLQKQLGLSTRHRHHLQQRGLIDSQIDAGYFFSIEPNQEIFGISPKLAGVDLWGRKLLIKAQGIACPIFDVQGRLVGWQTRFDNVTENKYRWPTSRSRFRPHGSTSHLQNGELPITCCRPTEKVRFKTIGMAEGFLKPYIAAQRRGQVILGAAGGAFELSPQQLKESLEQLKMELGTQIVEFYTDAGAILNRHVTQHYEKTWELLRSWGYEVRLPWWGQISKDYPDIDELDSSIAIGSEGTAFSMAYISPEEFLALQQSCQPLPRTGHQFSTLGGWLFKLKNQLGKLTTRTLPWGFGKKGEIEVEPTPTKTTPTIEYEEGKRLSVWTESVQGLAKYIWDGSLPSLGKSHDSGVATSELFKANQVMYLSAEHRNPTVSTLASWTDLEARHAGLVRDEFNRLRRAKQGETLVKSANCGRNGTINALRSLNIHGADTAGLICQTCPHLEACRAGGVYGYLHDRAEALKSSEVRAHPESLPDEAEYDYSNVVLIWDEVMTILRATRTVEVSREHLDRVIVELATKVPQEYHKLMPILSALRSLLTGEKKQPNKFGWSNSALEGMLPEVPDDLDLGTIDRILAPDLKLLDPTLEYGISAADLPAGMRKRFGVDDSELADQITKHTIKNWLLPFLEVLGGLPGALRIVNGVLKITLPDQRLSNIAKAAKANIFLDATATAEDIALLLGIRACEIVSVRQQTPSHGQLEVIQVTTLGRLGRSGRSDYCSERIDAVVKQIQTEDPNTKVIDFKQFARPGWGRWWIESRGVNDFEEVNTLVLIGVPCRNLGELEAEFAVLYGRSPQPDTVKVKYPVHVNGKLPDGIQPYFEMETSADCEFREFVRRHILADIHQALGRLRAHRRPGQKLRVYFLGDYPLDFPVTLKKASDITVEAATKDEWVEIAIRKAVQQLNQSGQKITQSAIASLTGYSQQHISRFRDLLKTLLDDSNRKMSKTSNESLEPEKVQEARWLGSKYLPFLKTFRKPQAYQPNNAADDLSTGISPASRSTFPFAIRPINPS